MAGSLHSAEYLRLRQALTLARRSAGLTQQQLAKRLKKPQSFVAKFELGERRLDVVEFLAVCTALGLNPCEILMEISESNGPR